MNKGNSLYRDRRHNEFSFVSGSDSPVQLFSKRRCSSSFFQSETYLKTGINSKINPKAFLAVHINISLSDCRLNFLPLLCLMLKKNAIDRHHRMCQSFLCKVQKPYVYCLFRNVLILSLQLRRASLAHPFGNQVNQNPRFT